MGRNTQRILDEIGGLRTEIHGEINGLRSEIHGEINGLRGDLRVISARIDSLHGRVDTVIDSLADLRTDFDRHTHDS